LLAVACGAGGQLLAATDRALYHQAGKAWARLGGEQVGRVGWDEQRHILMLTGLPPAVLARTVLRLAPDWRPPAVAARPGSRPSVSAGRCWLTSGLHSARMPGRGRWPGASPAGRRSPG